MRRSVPDPPSSHGYILGKQIWRPAALDEVPIFGPLCAYSWPSVRLISALDAPNFGHLPAIRAMRRVV